MVEREKVVVILLLITIILSVVSAVMTLTLKAPTESGSQGSTVKPGQIQGLENAFEAQTGEVSLGIAQPST